MGTSAPTLDLVAGMEWHDTSTNPATIKLLKNDLTTWETMVKTMPTGDIVGTTDTQTLTNKTLTDSTTTFQDDADTTKKMKLQLSSIATGTTRTLTIPDADATVVGTTTTQTITNKTLDNTNIATIKDANLTIQDDGDTTKQVKFEASGITTGTTRTLTIPNTSSTIEVTANKNASSGYAGLDSSTKLTASQMQEVITLSDLTNVTSITPATGDILYYDGTTWNKLARGANKQVLTATATTINWAAGGNVLIESSHATSYQKSIQHFIVSLGMSAIGSSNPWVINDADNDEMKNHSAKASSTFLTAQEVGAEVDNLRVYHTKNDLENSYTKATVEFRFKLGLRTANFKNFIGLNDYTRVMNTTTNRKICVFESNGNFFLRTSDGTTESDLDTGTVGDTSVHKWKFVWQSGSVEVLLDGVSKGTKTTNIPAIPLYCAGSFRNDTGVDQTSNAVWDYVQWLLE